MKKLLVITLVSVIFSTALSAQENPSLNNSYWNAVISGNTQLVLELKINKDKFVLVSRKGSNRDILGSKYLLGRLTGKVNPHCIEIEGSCFYRQDTLFLKGKYQSLSAKFALSGAIVRDQLNLTTTNNSVTGTRCDKPEPRRDYPSIARSAIDTTEKYLFNPDILESKEWISFKKKVMTQASVVMDDYEFEKMYNINGQKLPFTHYGIVLERPEITSVQNKQSSAQKQEPAKFELKRMNEETVLFTVHSFSASAEEINPYIDSMKNMEFSKLIVDLRNNGGGTIASALPLARYLVKDTLYGGAFLTQKYFAKHSEIPGPDSYTDFPLFSEASFAMIINGIHSQEGLCLVVYPDDLTFQGDLYMLTNNRTASTCEPLVYGLQSSKRATIVGETTCGAMLNGEQFKLHSEFGLWMPTADFYAADGFKIDKVGITPDIEVDPADALSKTMEIIKNK